MTRPDPRDVAVAGALACAAAALAAHPVFSSDGLWQLKLGRVIAETGRIPRVDLFSAVHPDRPWVQFQWLWEWAYYQLWRATGWWGLRAAQGLLMGASLATVYGVLRTRCARPWAAALGALVLALYADRFRLRPDASNLLFTFALLPVWLGGFRKLGGPGLAALFGATCLWSNLHAGASLLALASAGALLTGCLAHSALGRAAPADRRRAARAFAACAAGLVASPIFLPGLAHFLGIYRFMVDTGNPEWAPTVTILREQVSAGTLLVAAAPSVATLVYAASWVRAARAGGLRSLDLSELLLCTGYLALSHHAVRNVYLCSAPLWLGAARLLEGQPPARGRRAAKPWAGWVLAAALGLVVADQHVAKAYGSRAVLAETFRYDFVPGLFPEALTRFMDEAGIEGPILNHGPWGGWLIWQRWPASGVFLDTRYNVTPEMYQVYLRARDPRTRLAAMEEAFRRWGVELAVYPGRSVPLRDHPRWQLLMKAGDAELYQHVAGRHARQNLAARDDWLAARGHGPADALRVGGALWLEGPWQRFRRARDDRAASAGDAAAARRLAGLWWRAERCERALRAYARAEALEPLTATSLVRRADCKLRAGDLPGARADLRRTTGAPLSPDMEVLRAALARASL